MANLVDMAIHINEDVSYEARREIQDEIREMDGVMVATSRDEQPHFLLVGYDPSIIESNAILKSVKRHGFHAKLIGL